MSASKVTLRSDGMNCRCSTGMLALMRSRMTVAMVWVIRCAAPSCPVERRLVVAMGLSVD